MAEQDGLGDYRDGSSISFVPRVRTSKVAGRVAAVLLLGAAAVLVVHGVWAQQTSSPIKNQGLAVPGVLLDVAEHELDGVSGLRALISYQTSGDSYQTWTEETVGTDAAQKIGTGYTVFLDRTDPTKTFIPGIDDLDAPWPAFAAAAALALIGGILAVRTPETRTRRPGDRDDRRLGGLNASWR